ncbi:hypothetical protein [Schleiferilactobacillus harbinensis]|uniref:hypothetical protein n=1 Tax=Schleiferilactobacillus harbinensis TaxID=304207 RepID=UPI00116D087D|nr:hypothetical protein [Schleiferilactobacillus harbinensis]GEK05254.1 hypothetical protein LHA01_04930 [Schleiferilactobacillus harbinensis]
MGNDQTLARGGAGLSDTDVLTVMIAFGSLMLLLVDVMIKLIELTRQSQKRPPVNYFTVV